MFNHDVTPKIGSGHAKAMARLGLAELRAAVAFQDSNVVQPTPYGIFGAPTPSEVHDGRQQETREDGNLDRSDEQDRENERERQTMDRDE